MSGHGEPAVGYSEGLRYFVDELRRRLKDRLVKVVLFGSHAKGMAGPESDLDILVVHTHPNPEEALRLVADAAAEIALKHNVPLEPIVMTIHEYSQESMFTLEVKRTGRILYSVDPSSEARELARDHLYLAEKWPEHVIKDLEAEPRSAVDPAHNAAELAAKGPDPAEGRDAGQCTWGPDNPAREVICCER